MNINASALREGSTIGAESERAREVPEEEWLQRAQAGETAGFERLYRHHVGRIHALCLRLTGKAQVAEEMTQEVFLRAWQKLATIQGASHLGAWLHRVAVNLVINERRTWVKRNSQNVLEHPTAGRLDEPQEPSPVFRGDLEKAISALPAGARAAFVLHDVYGYRHEEIATMTGRAVGTTKAQLHRARKRLREVLR